MIAGVSLKSPSIEDVRWRLPCSLGCVRPFPVGSMFIVSEVLKDDISLTHGNIITSLANFVDDRSLIKH